MIPDDLSGLTTFLLVAEKRSFTAAAAELRVTPSAVSQTITALEERVGARLLARTSRKVGLTEAGEAFLTRVQPAIDEVRAAMATIEHQRERPAGVLRISVGRLTARYLIEPIVDSFLSTYPEVTLDLIIDDGFTDLVASGFDAGIRLGEHLERDMIAARVSTDQRMAVVGSPAYFAAHGKPRHPRDLRDHHCINYRMVTAQRIYQWEFTEDGRDFDIAVNGRYQVNDMDMMADAALRGVGLAYVIENCVRDALADGRLIRVLGSFCPPFPGFFIYYPSRRHLPRKLQVFIQMLQKHWRVR